MRQRFGLGAFHVGLVTGQPEKPRTSARLLAYRDAAAVGARSNVQEFQAVIIHACDRRQGGEGVRAQFRSTFRRNRRLNARYRDALSLTYGQKLPILSIRRIASRTYIHRGARWMPRRFAAVCW